MAMDVREIALQLTLATMAKLSVPPDKVSAEPLGKEVGELYTSIWKAVREGLGHEKAQD